MGFLDGPMRVRLGAEHEVQAVGCLTSENISLAQRNADLSRENARLAKENAIIQENALLAKENARLLQENARLSQQAALSYGSAASAELDSWGQTLYPTVGSIGSEDSLSCTKAKKKMSRALFFRDGQGSKTPAASNSYASTATGSLTSSCPTEVTPDEPSGPLTTVMMRHLPISCTRDMLVELLFKNGFGRSFDLVYVPVDFKTETGLGYAFVNLADEETANRFKLMIHGFNAWGIPSDKVCEISWSDAIQGLEPHVERYRNSPVMHESVPDDFKPALYKDGQRIPFPGATRKIRSPRPWVRR